MKRRSLLGPVLDSLRHFPAVLLVGPRQVGKSTLCQQVLAETGGSYVTLDEPAALAAALADPDGFVAAQPDGLLALDEVQRAPELLRACKRLIDRDRSPGRFLLTGSADINTLASVAETMAGRVIVHRLRPLSWSEFEDRDAVSLDALFAADSAAALVAMLAPRTNDDAARLHERIVSGGMPVPALIASSDARNRWLASYLQTYVERDLLELTSAQNLPDFRRLVTALALRTGRLRNHAEISRDLSIPATTLRRFLATLQQTFQVEMLAPYLGNREKRLVKSPKVFAEDSGLAAHLAGIATWATAEQRGLAGQLFETWVFGELQKLLDLDAMHGRLHFWRTHHNREVDFVIERGEQVIGIEVKSRTTIRAGDLSGLAALAEAMGPRLVHGIVLHAGSEATVLGPRLCALPVSALF